MDELDRAAGKFEFLERPLIGSKQTFISPPPAVKFRRRFQRQPVGIENVCQQPDVVFGLTRGLDANEPAQQRRLFCFLRRFRPIIDQSFLPVFQGRVVNRVQPVLGRHSQ